jgi:hypothetical protein
MSDDDPTKDIGEKYETRPTIETILDMRELRTALRKHLPLVK